MSRPCRHRKGWVTPYWSPARSEFPVTSPDSFNPQAHPKTPPRVPRSLILLCCQRKGSSVGRPVLEFGAEFVYEHPDIWPRWLMNGEIVSGPPSVPISRIPVPFSQMKPRVCVPHPKSEY